jgi:uncharacterized protein YdaU (DUF1376 family)
MVKPKPAFQMYAADFYADTAMLTQAELGALVRIMCQHWRGMELLTKEDQEGAAIGPVTDRLTRHIERELERLDQLRSEYSELSATRSEAGKLGGRPKAKGKQLVSKDKAHRVRVNSNSSEEKGKKTWNARTLEERREAFKSECKAVIESEPDRLHPDLRKAFFNYWTESDQKGIMRFEAQKHFEIPLRMDTWQRNAKAKGEIPKEPGVWNPRA